MDLHTLQRATLLYGLPSLELETMVPYVECSPVKVGVDLKTDAYVYFLVNARCGVYELVHENYRYEVAVLYPGEATSIVQGLARSSIRSVARVTSEGLVHRLSMRALKDLNLPTLRYRLDSLDANVLGRVLRTLTCSTEHTLSQRVARFLLTQLEPRIPLSQQAIADALGCRREGVTGIIGALKDEAVIYHTRGVITIRDRVRLKQWSCSCETHLLGD